jgi:hypothetical protein
MEKVDLKKQLDAYKAKAGKPQIIDVPAMSYIIIDGKGNPNTSADFASAIEALFTVAYTLKFTIKKGQPGIDYSVMPLEATWWADDMTDFLTGNKDNWLWSAMIMQPDFVTASLYEEAVKTAKGKKNLPALAKMRFETIIEGKCAQVLYVGPYDMETETIRNLHLFAHNEGYQLHGKHREIYLNDSRKTAPEKLKTIIRQPVIGK